MTSKSTIQSYDETPKPKSYDKDLAQRSRIAGTVIIFDLVNSTKLKVDKQFPNWIEDYIPFYNLVAKPFDEKKIWFKFLGDAFFFFIPDKGGFNKGKEIYPKLGEMTYEDVYHMCKEIMKNYWKHYKIYCKKDTKGDAKHINFREITCAIDYGNEVFNWYQLLETEDKESHFDPIGKTLDRCFRFSGIAGAGQIVISEYFYQKLIDENRDHEQSFIKIHIIKETLKGFPDITDVYLDRPIEEKIDHFLSDKNVELIENAKPMDVKAKLKLFRERISKLEEKIDAHKGE